RGCCRGTWPTRGNAVPWLSCTWVSYPEFAVSASIPDRRARRTFAAASTIDASMPASCDAIGPRDLPPGNLVERLPPPLRKNGEFGAPMIGVLRKGDEPAGGQFVGNPLNRLPAQPHVAGNLCHRQRTFIHGAQHLPSRAGQAEILRKAIARCQQTSVEPEPL